MTEDQKTLARGLVGAWFPPGINTKRFAREMAFNARQPDPKPLTPNQAEYLRTAVIRFRRSIPAEVVALAERMGQAPKEPPP